MHKNIHNNVKLKTVNVQHGLRMTLNNQHMTRLEQHSNSSLVWDEANRLANTWGRAHCFVLFDKTQHYKSMRGKATGLTLVRNIGKLYPVFPNRCWTNLCKMPYFKMTKTLNSHNDYAWRLQNCCSTTNAWQQIMRHLKCYCYYRRKKSQRNSSRQMDCISRNYTMKT